MYDHAKWLRSTWASSSSPDDRTFPGKPATSDELREDFPGGSVVKNPANAGDTRDAGLIPGSGRSPKGRNGNPLQYTCRENPMHRSV